METTLYPGIAFSPQATLTNNIGAADTIISVSDVSAFPAPPNLATIGTDEEGETILYTAKTETSLSGCQRGVEGTARSWMAGELIGRNFTAKDHNDLIAATSETRTAATAAQNAAEEATAAAQAAQNAAEEAEGKPGSPGKTAYQYAVDGGYKGTEAQFKALMGTGPWLPLSGGKMTGAMNVQAPIGNENPATKKYVDDVVSTVTSVKTRTFTVSGPVAVGGEFFLSYSDLKMNPHNGNTIFFGEPIKILPSTTKYQFEVLEYTIDMDYDPSTGVSLYGGNLRVKALTAIPEGTTVKILWVWI